METLSLMEKVRHSKVEAGQVELEKKRVEEEMDRVIAKKDEEIMELRTTLLGKTKLLNKRAVRYKVDHDDREMWQKVKDSRFNMWVVRRSLAITGFFDGLRKRKIL